MTAPEPGIDPWIQCANCGSPNTNHEVYSDGSITLSCGACGFSRQYQLDPIGVA